MKLNEISFDKLLDYAKGRTQYSYMNKSVLEIVYNFCVKKNLRVEGKRCSIRWDIDKEPLSYISNFLGTEPKNDNELRELQIEELLSTVWCKAEWAARCLTRDTFGASSVESEFGKKICKQIKEVA